MEAAEELGRVGRGEAACLTNLGDPASQGVGLDDPQRSLPTPNIL